MPDDLSTDLPSGEIPCPSCGAFFLPIKRHVACDACRARLSREKARRATGVSLAPGIGSGAVGAIAELIVTADLLRRGYEVFRAVSPTASCDMLALRGDRKLRVEVRAGRVRDDGRLLVKYGEDDIGKQDLLAIVSGANQIRYRVPMIVRGFGLVGFEDIDP